jgi:nicotinate-nucleotide adenylyltransferase
MKHRTGIYSGTFDPVHPGHIAFAEETLRICNLDEVVFIPEKTPRGKNQVTDLVHRIALIERTTAEIVGLSVIQLASEQFTVTQTLPELHKLFNNNHLTLLVGSDVARSFSYGWNDLGILLHDVSIAIGLRESDNPDEITAIMEQLAHDYTASIDYTLISTPEAGIASSLIRNGTIDQSRLHSGALAYIQEHQLYTPQI